MAQIKIPVSTIDQLVARMETVYADRVAMRYYDEAAGTVREVLYRDYAADIRRMSALLTDKVPGIRGRRVCVLAANSYHYAVSIFGTILSGAVLVPLNLQKPLADIRYELELVEASLILHDGRYLERESGLEQLAGDRLVSITAYRDYAPGPITPCADRDALMAILFTSGTTGHSKGVMLSQRNLFAPMPAFCDPFRVMLEQMGVDHYDFCHFTVLPMFHIAAFTSLVSLGHHGDGPQPLPGPAQLLPGSGADAQRRHRRGAGAAGDHPPGRDAGTPGPVRAASASSAAARRPIPPATLIDLMRQGFFVMQMYGLTETAGDGTWNNAQDEGAPVLGGHRG